jgi:hypothetical protein
MKADFEKGTKICSKCRRELSIEQFNKDSSKSDGLNMQCKDCVAAYRKSPEGKEVSKRARKKFFQTEKGKECTKRQTIKRAQDESYKEKARIRSKNWYEQNKPEPKRIDRKVMIDEEEYLYCTHCKKLLPIVKFHKDNNQKYGYDSWCKDCRREFQIRKLSTEDGKKKNRERRKKYSKTEKGKFYSKTYTNRKFKQDINYKNAKLLRSRILKVLKGEVKSANSLNLIGCSLDELKVHLEQQFEPGMTWDNQGEWHIDHIIPCSRFDLSNPIHQRICFNYRNLQPLWARDNYKKSDELLEGWEDLLKVIMDELCISSIVYLK